MLSREWRCSWSSADRRCSNYIWVIDNLIAYLGAACIRGFTVSDQLYFTAPHANTAKLAPSSTPSGNTSLALNTPINASMVTSRHEHIFRMVTVPLGAKSPVTSRFPAQRLVIKNLLLVWVILWTNDQVTGGMRRLNSHVTPRNGIIELKTQNSGYRYLVNHNNQAEVDLCIACVISTYGVYRSYRCWTKLL